MYIKEQKNMMYICNATSTAYVTGNVLGFITRTITRVQSTRFFRGGCLICFCYMSGNVHH